MASKTAAGIKDAPPAPTKAAPSRKRADKAVEQPVEAPAAVTPTPQQPPAPPEHELLEDGRQVISVEPVPSNLPPKANGERVYRKGVVSLLLADGSKVLRCADCSFTGSMGSVLSHRGRAHPTAGVGIGRGRERQPRQPRQAPGHSLPDSVAMMSLGDVIEMGRQLETISIALSNVTEQRDEYRDRCIELERETRQIKRGLRMAGFIPEPIEPIESTELVESTEVTDVTESPEVTA